MAQPNAGALGNIGVPYNSTEQDYETEMAPNTRFVIIKL